jgi:hypothetical protein
MFVNIQVKVGSTLLNYIRFLLFVLTRINSNLFKDIVFSYSVTLCAFPAYRQAGPCSLCNKKIRTFTEKHRGDTEEHRENGNLGNNNRSFRSSYINLFAYFFFGNPLIQDFGYSLYREMAEILCILFQEVSPSFL